MALGQVAPEACTPLHLRGMASFVDGKAEMNRPPGGWCGPYAEGWGWPFCTGVSEDQ